MTTLSVVSLLCRHFASDHAKQGRAESLSEDVGVPFLNEGERVLNRPMKVKCLHDLAQAAVFHVYLFITSDTYLTVTLAQL